MSPGAVVGIVLGVLIGTAAIGIAAYFGTLYFKRRAFPPLASFNSNNYDNLKTLSMPSTMLRVPRMTT